MAIEPDQFQAIRPGSEMGLLVARRMAGATWLTVPEPETNEKGGEMANNICIEPGCGKLRVRDKRCTKHGKEFREALQRSEAAETAPKGRSLLGILDVAEQRPGFFLDFTGEEELLAKVRGLSDDVNQDVLSLLRGLLAGELYKRPDVEIVGAKQ